MKACTEWLGIRDNNSNRETTLPFEFLPTVTTENKSHPTAEMSSFPERERRIIPNAGREMRTSELIEGADVVLSIHKHNVRTRPVGPFKFPRLSRLLNSGCKPWLKHGRKGNSYSLLSLYGRPFVAAEFWHPRAAVSGCHTRNRRAPCSDSWASAAKASHRDRCRTAKFRRFYPALTASEAGETPRQS